MHEDNGKQAVHAHVALACAEKVVTQANPCKQIRCSNFSSSFADLENNLTLFQLQTRDAACKRTQTATSPRYPKP